MVRSTVLPRLWPDPLGYVAKLKEISLVNRGIEFPLGLGVAHVLGPAHEMVHGPLGPVAVVDLQGEAKGFQVRLHPGQGPGRGPGEQALGRLVPVHPGPQEIVFPVVTDIQEQVVHHLGHVQHVVRAGGGLRAPGRGAEAGQQQEQERNLNTAHRVPLVTGSVLAARPGGPAPCLRAARHYIIKNDRETPARQNGRGKEL